MKTWKFLVGLLAIVIFSFAAHYGIYRYLILEEALMVEKNGNKICNDQIRDLFFALRNTQYELESEKNSAYVSGMLDAMNRPNHYNEIWHDGYNRGSEVGQQMAETFLKGSPSELHDVPTKEVSGSK